MVSVLPYILLILSCSSSNKCSSQGLGLNSADVRSHRNFTSLRVVSKLVTNVFVCDFSDPIRPRNDKGSILAESILAVNELRAEIARMKSEQIALSDESRDVSFYSSPFVCLKLFPRSCTLTLLGMVSAPLTVQYIRDSIGVQVNFDL